VPLIVVRRRAAHAERGLRVAESSVPAAGCPGFVRISDIWPRSGQNLDSADRDLAEFCVARRLLCAPA
jgi:hypothetical protein